MRTRISSYRCGGDLLVEQLMHMVDLRAQEPDSVPLRHLTEARARLASNGPHTSS